MPTTAQTEPFQPHSAGEERVFQGTACRPVSLLVAIAGAALSSDGDVPKSTRNVSAYGPDLFVCPGRARRAGSLP